MLSKKNTAHSIESLGGTNCVSMHVEDVGVGCLLAFDLNLLKDLNGENEEEDDGGGGC